MNFTFVEIQLLFLLSRKYLKVTGDDVKVQSYERLSPLVPLKVPLGSFSNIRTGDCIVTFSRRDIYRLKVSLTSFSLHIFMSYDVLGVDHLHFQILLIPASDAILLLFGRLSCLNGSVYTLLLSEKDRKFGKASLFRSVWFTATGDSNKTGLQATMFNDASSESDVLVASDAIGMGLNLNISRIIFSTMEKFDGVGMRELTVPEVKQIAGRAGRYGSKFPKGEVTCLSSEDLPLLHSSLNSASPTLEVNVLLLKLPFHKCAGLFPTFDLIYMYSRLHAKSGLHEILEHFLENAKLSENYFIANCEEILKVAVVIDELPLGLHDKYLFCISPVDMKDDISSQGLTQFATTYATKGIVQLREIFTPGTLAVPKSESALRELESIHKVLDLYVWLSFRLEESFPDRELASSQKAICSQLIEDFLERLGWQKALAKIMPRPGPGFGTLFSRKKQYLVGKWWKSYVWRKVLLSTNFKDT
ncbi:hypothetical protein Pint_24769 [Pistacia integerrima]|uniref:Uncharacterized protein n=1 Tax=Pistacia integerrima TaxID=434235 RepID=A0ACC0YGK2_9ROSI|nr:hypothetical protein Pint_24769 [Pistacia integerrima]